MCLDHEQASETKRAVGLPGNEESLQSILSISLTHPVKLRPSVAAGLFAGTSLDCRKPLRPFQEPTLEVAVLQHLASCLEGVAPSSA